MSMSSEKTRRRDRNVERALAALHRVGGRAMKRRPPEGTMSPEASLWVRIDGEDVHVRTLDYMARERMVRKFRRAEGLVYKLREDS